MKILAIETTGKFASVALLETSWKASIGGSNGGGSSDDRSNGGGSSDDRSNSGGSSDDGAYNVYEKQGTEKFSHLQNLIPLIDELMKEHKLAIGDVTHIAVSQGPGSFTGIRIGMATAKALAQALDIPSISVPSLKALARNAGDFPGLICSVLDARREQVYCGGYILQDGKYVAVIEDQARSFAVFSEMVQAYCKEHNVKATFLGDDYRSHQKAASVALEAWEIAKAGGATAFYDVKPVYLRQAEAQRKLEERLGK